MSTVKLTPDSNGGSVQLKAPANTSGADVVLTLPNTDGNANQLLKTDGSGNLSWADDTDTTNTNASNLSSGTLPDARFPATLPAVSGANLTNLPGGGKLLQVQQVTYNTETSTNGSTWTDVHSTNFKVDITPGSTASHFIIHVHMNGITVIGDDVNYAQFRLKGSGSGIDTEEWFGYNIGLTQSANHEWTRGMATASYTYYETAQLSGTGTVTFKVQWRGSNNDLSDNVYIGYGGGGASECSIVVMEVSPN